MDQSGLSTNSGNVKCSMVDTHRAQLLLTWHHLIHNRRFCFRLWCKWRHWATPAFSWWAAVERHLRREHGLCLHLWFHSASWAAWFHLHTGDIEPLQAKWTRWSVTDQVSQDMQHEACRSVLLHAETFRMSLESMQREMSGISRKCIVWLFHKYYFYSL